MSEPILGNMAFRVLTQPSSCLVQLKLFKTYLITWLDLIRQDNVRRHHWPIWRVVKLFLGADNIVCAVDVKLPDGSIVKRSANKLHFMETFEPDGLEESCEYNSDLDIPNIQIPSSDFVTQSFSDDNVNTSNLDVPFVSDPLDTQNC